MLNEYLLILFIFILQTIQKSMQMMRVTWQHICSFGKHHQPHSDRTVDRFEIHSLTLPLHYKKKTKQLHANQNQKE